MWKNEHGTSAAGSGQQESWFCVSTKKKGKKDQSDFHYYSFQINKL